LDVIVVTDVLQCHLRSDDIEYKVCSGCHNDVFCSTACQKAAWPSHRVVCKSWQKLLRGTYTYLPFVNVLESDVTVKTGHRHRFHCTINTFSILLQPAIFTAVSTLSKQILKRDTRLPRHLLCVSTCHSLVSRNASFCHFPHPDGEIRTSEMKWRD
jgi:hypothetical protein